MKFRFRIPFTNVQVASRGFILQKLNNGIALGYNVTRPKAYGYVLGVYDSSLFGLCIYRRREDITKP